MKNRTWHRPVATIACVWALAWPATAGALPVINEVCYDAVGPDAAGVFTEIFGTAGMDLSGWSLVGINGGDGAVYRTVDLTGAVIPFDGILVVATDQAAGDLLGVRDFIGNVDWQNGPDAVQLIDPNGVVADALQYGDAGVFNAGEGNFAVDVMAGQSLSREPFGADTDDNLRDFVVLDTPTPGVSPPVAAVPEPGTMLLLGAGLVGVAGLRRKNGRG